MNAKSYQPGIYFHSMQISIHENKTKNRIEYPLYSVCSGPDLMKLSDVSSSDESSQLSLTQDPAV